MDLKEFYFQNIKESEYHYRFLGTYARTVTGDGRSMEMQVCLY